RRRPPPAAPPFPTRRSSGLNRKRPERSNTFDGMLDQVENSMNVCMTPCPIVFDLDGTLIDSAPDIHACVNAVLREFHVSPLTLRSEEHTSELQSRENIVCRL